MSFVAFFNQVLTSVPLVITVILTTAVIFVNGWTDAPNAIATTVSTRSMAAKPAIFWAAVFNFLGVLIMTAINSTVAQTVFNMVDFGTNVSEAFIGLCAAMTAIVLWAVAAWAFGIPTSESHALIAGLSGAAIALHGGLEGINGHEWSKVLIGLALSTFMGFGIGYLVKKAIEIICARMHRRKLNNFFRVMEVGGGMAMAFMHGAQDGQKFMSVFILGIYLTQGMVAGEFTIPFWLMVYTSLAMGIGTSIGGYKIIKSVGMDMVKLNTYKGFSADLAAAVGLLVCTVNAIPVSTTHMKTTAIMGAGMSGNLSSINWAIVRDMVLAWVLTFPGCGLVGFLMAKLFVAVF